MKLFELTQKAKNDLIDIARYTEKKWGLVQRNVYIKQFDDCFHLLAENAFAGKECSNIKKDYRKFPQGSHIIFYTSGERSNIRIVRILHKNMVIESKFMGK
ncbi:MAG: type II toxin-antitoxin system RelE/ParE family toxin [Pseudomonadales bacterium]|nr:type II toxin-antitoxin system RelE/ParE family toxin [Pseudomonadales bacterium]